MKLKIIADNKGIPCILASLSFSIICSSSNRLKCGRSPFNIYLENSTSSSLLVSTLCFISYSKPDGYISNIQYRKMRKIVNLEETITDIDEFKRSQACFTIAIITAHRTCFGNIALIQFRIP